MVIVTQILIGVVLFFIGYMARSRHFWGYVWGCKLIVFWFNFSRDSLCCFLTTARFKIQREELELTRIELERSANAQEASSSILSKQLEIMAKDSEFLMQKEIKESEPFLYLMVEILEEIKDKTE